MRIELFGVNETRHERGNDLIDAMDVDLPWLQDDTTNDVWNRWQVGYRDLVILDRANRRVAIFNLTENDLGDPETYARLRTLLLEIAGVTLE